MNRLCLLVMSGILSAKSSTPDKSINQKATSRLGDEIKKPRTGDKCFNNLVGEGGRFPLEGCPTEIPIIENGAIVAARVYREKGNDIPELACNGDCGTWYAETKFSQAAGNKDPFGSVIINPGCTVYVFPEYQFQGIWKAYTGPTIMPNPQLDNPVIQNCGVPCISSFLFTCKQIFPSCTLKDAWVPVTELDNVGSFNPTTFTYKKTVGTDFSTEMKQSLSISATVSASISASFWGIAASVGVSATTGYDWSKTDTETKSVATTIDVQVTVPAKVKVIIEVAVGTCGGSTIHTQLFRVLDKNTVLKQLNGQVSDYSVPEKVCCDTKTVGDYTYTKVSSTGKVPPTCLNDCVYTRNDKPGSEYCFANGEQEVQCSA